ncbi:beta-ketoacyl synthase N-terminal-like domain-containing protein [Streptomyces sp. NPDC060184]|uniref:beta-ketoacyl synthase N-terminal-like domain-containing protein n=1 Tax=Streptomyces sp. NPDC060184 TaxID=3347064 RepID=UPI00365A6E1C
MRDVLVTGIGVVLPGCDTRDALWRQLSRGSSQLTLEPAPGPASRHAVGRIRAFDAHRYLGEFPEPYYGRCPRDVQLYLSSLVLAREDAALTGVPLAPDRVGLFDGTSRGSFAAWYARVRSEGQQPARELYTRRELAMDTPGQAVGVGAALLRTEGPALTFTASCSSAPVALGHACREVARGAVDVAFAGGHEAALVPPLHLMYQEAGLCSAEYEDPARAVRPWTGGSGNAFGEGAVTLVLEAREHAERRGARGLATMRGYAYGNTGRHPTHVDSSADRPARVVRQLLDEAGVQSRGIGFVVGHGNGVAASDASEIRLMRAVFGRRSGEVPLISTKPLYGHTLGAAGALNAAAAVLMLHHGRTVRSPNAPDDPVEYPDISFGHGDALPSARRNGICLSFGLGGHNSALLFSSRTKESP